VTVIYYSLISAQRSVFSIITACCIVVKGERRKEKGVVRKKGNRNRPNSQDWFQLEFGKGP